MSNGKKTTTKTTNAKEMKKIKVEEKENEMAEDFKEEKNDRKNIIIKILDITLWIVLIGWMAICLYDFYNVKNEKDPKFCIKEEIIQYEDGTVESCLGPGYKVYNYKRDSFNAIEFGPFWAKDRSAAPEEE